VEEWIFSKVVILTTKYQMELVKPCLNLPLYYMAKLTIFTEIGV
jgi:hypothetical protein